MVSGDFIGGIWMVSLDVCGVRICLRGDLGAHTLQGGELTRFWHNPEKQDFLVGHTEISRYQILRIRPKQNCFFSTCQRNLKHCQRHNGPRV